MIIKALAKEATTNKTIFFSILLSTRKRESETKCVHLIEMNRNKFFNLKSH